VTGHLILGLGNPGARYRDTRHNLGFRVVDELARRWGVAVDRLECGCLLGVAAPVLLARPQTYMNRSGHAARCLVERHGFAPGDLLVVYDDLALPLARIRLRPGGSPGGHRGMESVVESLRTDRVPRLRLGIAPSAEGPPPGDGWVGFVLEPFDPDEREPVREMTARAADACEAWLEDGIESAMNRFNG
jgi:PTH1 family peptidyl-tRNA hydrolase